MDATCKSVIVCGCLLAALSGCYPMYDSPAARPVQPVLAEPQPPSTVAGAATEENGEAELVSETIQQYIRRIDDVGSLAQRSRLREERDTLAAAAPLPAQGPPDTRPLPTSERSPGRTPAQANGEPVVSFPDVVQATTAPAMLPTTNPATTTVMAMEPPVIGTVSVRADPAVPTTPPPHGEPAPPRVNTRATATNAPITLSDFIRQWPGDSEEASFREQLDRRVLRVVAGDYEGARRPLTMVSAQQQEMAAHLLESLIVIREEAHGGDPSGAADRVRAEWERLAEALRPLSELRIPKLAICREVIGYGQYELIDPPRFPAGVPSEFVAYCEVRDFVRERQEDGMYETRFEMRTRILDAAGNTVLDIRDTDIVDRCRQPRQDCFIPRLVRLPASLSPGEYVVKITLVDKLGQKVAENRATFRLSAGR